MIALVFFTLLVESFASSLLRSASADSWHERLASHETVSSRLNREPRALTPSKRTYNNSPRNMVDQPIFSMIYGAVEKEHLISNETHLPRPFQESNEKSLNPRILLMCF